MLTAGKKASADSGMTEDVMNELHRAKCGVLIGSAMGGMRLSLKLSVFHDAIEALRVSYKKMNPCCVPFATSNMGSSMFALDLGWMGPNYSISTACKLLASGGQDKKAVLWHTDSFKPKTTQEEHFLLITDVRFGPSMSRLATSSLDKTVRIWDADNLEERMWVAVLIRLHNAGKKDKIMLVL
ncbi:hypothetical protein MKW98_020653 [Papaver atlanticum]|uniref:beta-ketoacyl-[acyl-carrier-protein] synthase I n=1 Tax=Papaver atlanticum TaxID=357466 RepID=A0AAD4XUV1_9MAGN|nr:hypothetical protein MKW98_020653 [Papaver atlanticum]